VTIYTVLWSPVAENRLADLWTSGPDRGPVAYAENYIDRLLRTDPNEQGESRSFGTRILFHPPLGVIYKVKEQDRTVTVLKVWKYARRKS
jgi:plasmid stabilization system protein ParE